MWLLLLILIAACDGFSSGGVHGRTKLRDRRTLEVSCAFDERCNFEGHDPVIPSLEARIRVQFEIARGKPAPVESLVKRCIQGNHCWLFCGGTVESFAPEDGDPMPPGVRDLYRRSRALVRVDRNSDELATGQEMSARAPALTEMMQSQDDAAAAFARRARATVADARLDAELQRILHRHCDSLGAPRLSLRDLDAYRGAKPERLYCDTVITNSRPANVYDEVVFDRRTGGWHKRQ